jgi:hypothetical protein
VQAFARPFRNSRFLDTPVTSDRLPGARIVTNIARDLTREADRQVRRKSQAGLPDIVFDPFTFLFLIRVLIPR